MPIVISRPNVSGIKKLCPICHTTTVYINHDLRVLKGDALQKISDNESEFVDPKKVYVKCPECGVSINVYEEREAK